MFAEELRPSTPAEQGHLSTKVAAGLAQLAEAADYARDAGRDPWDFAVETAGLLALGLTVSDLRWLASKGYVEHACEVTRPEDPARRFCLGQNLTFGERTCFVLAPAGMLLLRNGPADAATFHLVGQGEADSQALFSGAHIVPHWDDNRRVLSVAGRVVKQFRVPSPNQEAVLKAFERESWPPSISDPLPPVAQQQSKVRLHDTIKCLNGKQQNHLVRFRGNGRGEGVLWELIDQHALPQVPVPQGLRRAA
jgi:hypothetical protein